MDGQEALIDIDRGQTTGIVDPTLVQSQDIETCLQVTKQTTKVAHTPKILATILNINLPVDRQLSGKTIAARITTLKGGITVLFPQIIEVLSLGEEMSLMSLAKIDTNQTMHKIKATTSLCCKAVVSNL